MKQALIVTAMLLLAMLSACQSEKEKKLELLYRKLERHEKERDSIKQIKYRATERINSLDDSFQTVFLASAQKDTFDLANTPSSDLTAKMAVIDLNLGLSERWVQEAKDSILLIK